MSHNNNSMVSCSTGSTNIDAPSPYTKKVRASQQVFGDIIVQDITNNSLCYSPSPMASNNSDQQQCSTEDNDENSNTSTPYFFQFASTDGEEDNRNDNNESTDNGNSIINIEATEDNPQRLSTPKRSSDCSRGSGSGNGGPFQSIIGENHEEENPKENIPENIVNSKSITKNVAEMALKPKASGRERKGNRNAKSSNKNDKRLRLRSTPNQDIEKMTQDAINTAKESVNQTLNAVRRAKQESDHRRAIVTAKIRDQRREEKEEARNFHDEAEKSRQELLALQRQLSSKVRKAKAKAHRNDTQARLDAIDKESQFKSKVHRDHQKKLRDEADRKRRQSITARSKLRRNHRAGEEQMRLASIAEEQMIFDERHESSLAVTKTKKELSNARRKSFAFRNGDARRIRELHAKMEAEEANEEHDSYELKWAGEKDAEEYKRKLAEQRRQSLASRNKDAHRKRDLEKEIMCLEGANEQESYELKWAGEKDAEEYKRKLAEHRRKSLASRNEDANRKRNLEKEMRCKESANEHESYKLKWAGEKDAEAYQRELKEERRKSLEFRNKEGSNHRQLMEELQSIAREKEVESLMLKWAGENDAKAYIAQMEEDRRKSLQLRNEEGRRHRELDREALDKKTEEAHIEEELQAACAEDVKKYKNACAARDRDSLCFRRKEAHIQRIEESNERQRQNEIDEENRILDDAANRDVKEYLEDCKRRRRLSLVSRAKEKRQHAQLEKIQAEINQEERHRDTHYRSIDSRYEELARMEERKQIAMDAIRHANCTFGVDNFFHMKTFSTKYS